MNKLFKIKDEKGTIIPKNIFWLAFFGVLFVCVLYVVIMFFVPVKAPVNMESRGAFGDMFGAIGALFSGLAFAGLIVTMLQQREDLKNQKEEMTLQREEIELQRKDLEAQTEALILQKEEIAQTNKELQLQRAEMEAQNKTMMLQRFENTYFKLIDIEQSVLEETSYKHSIGVDAMYAGLYLSKGADMCDIDQRLFNFNNEIIKKGNFERYFQQVFIILDYVNRSTFLSAVEKFDYLCILRTKLSDAELAMLFYYCLSEHTHPEYKQLIERYAIFKNLKKANNIRQEHFKLYSEGAYKFTPNFQQSQSSNTI